MSEFEERKEEYAQRNEEVQERFERIAQRMRESLEDPLPEELEEETDALVAEYEGLRARISSLRKRGKDTFIASLMMRQFRPRLLLAKARREKEEFARAREVIAQIEKELDESERKEEVDVRKEVYALAGIAEDKE